MDAGTVELLVYAVAGVISVKIYLSYDTKKNDRDNESKERKAETYAKGKIREAQVENAAMYGGGFDDTEQSTDGIEGIISGLIQTPEGAEIMKNLAGGLLEKKT